MGLNMLIGIYIGGIYGGLCFVHSAAARLAPLLRQQPYLDGYPMAQKGEAGKALGMATIASTIGGLFAAVVLATSGTTAWQALRWNLARPNISPLRCSVLTIIASLVG